MQAVKKQIHSLDIEKFKTASPVHRALGCSNLKTLNFFFRKCSFISRYTKPFRKLVEFVRERWAKKSILSPTI